MATRPTLLVRRSLANDPLAHLLVFLATLGGLLGIFFAGDMPDRGAAITTSLVFAIATTIIYWLVKRRRWWRRLHHFPLPLDVESYVRALHGIADRAHFDVELRFAGSAPSADELVRLAGHASGATVDGGTAHVVSPSCRTKNRDSRPWMQYHTNQKLDRWFRKRVRALEQLHRQHAIQSIAVSFVRDA